MIQKHPETLDEMNELMTKVGKKWELNEMKVTKTVSTVKIAKPPDQAHRIRSTHKRHVSSESSFSEPIYSNESRTLPPPVPPRLQSFGQEYSHQGHDEQEYHHGYAQEYAHRGHTQGSYQGHEQEYPRRGHADGSHQSHRQGYSHPHRHHQK